LGLVGAALFGSGARAAVVTLAISNACGGTFAGLTGATGVFGDHATAAVGVGLALDDVVVRALDGAKVASVVAVVDAVSA